MKNIFTQDINKALHDLKYYGTCCFKNGRYISIKKIFKNPKKLSKKERHDNERS